MATRENAPTSPTPPVSPPPDGYCASRPSGYADRPPAGNRRASGEAAARRSPCAMRGRTRCRRSSGRRSAESAGPAAGTPCPPPARCRNGFRPNRFRSRWCPGRDPVPISEASRARTHHTRPRYRSGIRLENVAPDQEVTGARMNRLRATVDASSTSQGPHDRRSCGGGIRNANPAISGRPPGTTDTLRHPSDDVAGPHRQSVAVRRRPFQNPLGEHAHGMKETAAAYCGAEPDGNAVMSDTCTQWGAQIRLRETGRGGLTARIPGINPRQCCDTAAKTCSKGPCDNRLHRRARCIVASAGVYAPQEDSQFLIDVMEKTGLARERRVADLCTGGCRGDRRGQQGAAGHGIRRVFALRPVREDERLAAGVDVDVHLGSWARAAEFGPFDLVVCNPPYVPHDPDAPAHRFRRHRVGTRMGCRPRRPSRAGPAVRGGTRSARSRRRLSGGALRVRGSASNTCCTGLRRTGCGSGCLPVDSVRSCVDFAGGLAGGHRQAGARPARGGARGDQGGKTVTDTQVRTVRMVDAGPVMVQGPVHRDARRQCRGIRPVHGRDLYLPPQ